MAGKFPKGGNQGGSGRLDDMVKSQGGGNGKFGHRKPWQTGFDLTDKTRGRVGYLNLKRRNFGINFVPQVANGSALALPKSTPFAAAKHTISKEIVRWVLAGEGGASGTKTLRAAIYTPSNRLRLSITAACESDNLSAGDSAATDTTPVWSIRGIARNPETGRESSLQLVYPSSGTVLVPDAYEADTAATELRVEFTVTDFTASLPGWLTTATRAKLVLIAAWEPNTPMDEGELRELYNKCSVAYGSTVLMQNNG
jgi:hypothetical protein